MHASDTTASDDVRERVLRAVEKLGDEVGEDGITMVQIAACAGIRPGLLRRHFDGKEALLHEVRRRFEQEIDGAMSGAEAGLLDPHARLHRICTAYVTVARGDRWRYSLALAEHDRSACPMTIGVARAFVDRVAACLVDEPDPSGLALQIWRSIHALVEALLDHTQRAHADEARRYADRYIRMTLNFSGAETLDRL